MHRLYTLDNVANAGGSIHLSMTWDDASHLRVTYDSHPNVVFRVATIGEVTVTAEDESADTSKRHT